MWTRHSSKLGVGPLDVQAAAFVGPNKNSRRRPTVSPPSSPDPATRAVNPPEPTSRAETEDGALLRLLCGIEQHSSKIWDSSSPADGREPESYALTLRPNPAPLILSHHSVRILHALTLRRPTSYRSRRV
ncbi:hypothetical protein K523DRAFT_414942 [Schizophyllum commune Tattone D]|nr:hypothetical protein K523DRAFT_414942 [Schizophyllum commune Tattone D]